MYQAKNFDYLLGTNGLSEQLLKNHFTLYQGYVNNTNKILERLNNILKEGKTEELEYAELKRRLGWEFNGMKLHEYYFENLSKNRTEINKKSNLIKKINEDFNSYELWEKDFKAIGTMRGIGWTILYYDAINKKLINTWINEHDLGHLSGSFPILVMDVFEHAYLTDYGLKRLDYINVFFNNINWQIVEKRFENANKCK